MQMADYGSVAEWLLVVSVAIKQPTPPLHLARELAILRRIMKQVPIDIVGHGDRKVSNHRLYCREPTTLPDHFRKKWERRRDLKPRAEQGVIVLATPSKCARCSAEIIANTKIFVSVPSLLCVIVRLCWLSRN